MTIGYLTAKIASFASIVMVYTKIAYVSPNFTGTGLYMRIDEYFHFTLYNECNYLPIAGIKVNPC